MPRLFDTRGCAAEWVLYGAVPEPDGWDRNEASSNDLWRSRNIGRVGNYRGYRLL